MKYLINNLGIWDIFIFQKIYSWNGQIIVDRFFYWISRSGDGYIYAFLGIALIAFYSPHSHAILLWGIVAFAIELPLYHLIKINVKRPRPYDKLINVHFLIVPPDKFSFPSGHTAAAFIIAIVISELIPFLKIPLFIWAGLVALSRIYLGVHYPTDIIAGIILGQVSVWFSSLIINSAGLVI